jgi:hypothetical protein
MRRALALLAALIVAALPARADFGVGNLTGFGSGEPLKLRYIANVSQSNGGANIVLMNGIEPFDILVGVELPANSTATGVPANTGWSGWGGYNGATCTTGVATRYRLFGKVADGTEDGTTVTGMPDSASDKKAVLQFRPNKPVVAWLGSSVISVCSGTNPAQQTMTATGATSYPVLGIATFRANGGTVDPRNTSITPDVEVDIGGVGGAYVHAYIQDRVVADYTWDMGDEGDQNFLNGNYFYGFR